MRNSLTSKINDVAKVSKKIIKQKTAVKYAAFKFARYINSCTNSAHLMVADTLVSLFKMRFPDELVETTHLQNALQLRRIEIDHLWAIKIDA